MIQHDIAKNVSATNMNSHTYNANLLGWENEHFPSSLIEGTKLKY